MIIAFSSKIDYLCLRVIQLCEVWGIRLIDFRNQFVTHPFLSLILQFVNQRDSLNGNNQIIDDGILTDINQTILNRQLYGADTFDDPICSQCKYLPICNGGCPIQRIENKFEGGHNDCCSHYKGFMPDFLKIHIARKKAQEAAATEKQQ